MSPTERRILIEELSLLPEALREAFRDFSSLKSDEEKKIFWHKLARNLTCVPPETLSQLLKEGLLTLSDTVDVLDTNVRKQLNAEV